MLMKVHKFGELIFTLSGYQGLDWKGEKSCGEERGIYA